MPGSASKVQRGMTKPLERKAQMNEKRVRGEVRILAQSSFCSIRDREFLLQR